ncbi:MAG TPA: hypothetical protein VD902_16165 [Symbiobacteriaceae bacterium]|nr:hypothetical protein [Symbiobacteriaceae bacterium]
MTGPESFEHIPAIDEVISLVDWSLHVNQGLGHRFDPPRLYQVRRDLEHLMCATLDSALESRTARAAGPHSRFVRAVLAQPGRSFALLSLNYDTLLDDALVDAGITPDYGFRHLDLWPGGGPLLAKLHGSLNWALCPACGHIEVADGKVAHLLPRVEGLRCSRCDNDRLHGLIISPTWLKSYEGAHLQHVWDLALECMQQAERIVFVGYSMPPADVAIYHLICRGLLAGRCPRRPHIEVINHTDPAMSPAEQVIHRDAVAARFRRLFGPGVTFDFSGFHGQV